MLLDVESLTKSFGQLRVLEGFSFGVREGELKAIIGPNGAGKTTLFNVITGRYDPDAGRIRFRDKDITRAKPHVLSRMGLARRPPTVILPASCATTSRGRREQ